LCSSCTICLARLPLMQPGAPHPTTILPILPATVPPPASLQLANLPLALPTVQQQQPGQPQGIPGYCGIIKLWDGGKGYGFITCEGMPGDLMFLRSSLPRLELPQLSKNYLEGKQVQFDLVSGNAGKWQAANLQILSDQGLYMIGKIKSFNTQAGTGVIDSSMLSGVDIQFNYAAFQEDVSGMDLLNQLVIFQGEPTPTGFIVTKIMFQSGLRVEAGTGQVRSGMKRDAFQMGGMPGIGGMMVPGMSPNDSGMMNGGIAGGFSPAQGYYGQPGFDQASLPQSSNYIFQSSATAQGSQLQPAGFDQPPAAGFQPQSGGWDQFAPQQAAAIAQAQAGPGHVGHLPQAGPTDFENTLQMAAAAAQVNLLSGVPGLTNAGGFANGGFKKQKIEALTTGQFLSGTIKTYNAQKGFGFIVGSGAPGDVFFMRTDLPALAQHEDCKGCAVNFELMRTTDGKLRAKNITSAQIPTQPAPIL